MAYVGPIWDGFQHRSRKVLEMRRVALTGRVFSMLAVAVALAFAGTALVLSQGAGQSSRLAAAQSAMTGAGVTPGGAGDYTFVASDGGVFNFGNAGFFGSVGNQHLNRPVVGIAITPSGQGYWEVAADGGLFAFGDAGFYGSATTVAPSHPIVGIATTPSGLGYWEVASDGSIYPFGDAAPLGSLAGLHLNKPIVGMAATATGLGYWEVASDGGLFAFGDAGFYGSPGGMRINRPIVGLAATATGLGYWEVASDGGLFAFGDAGFYGSTGGMRLNQPIVGMAGTLGGLGYWEVASDGGLFAFGDAGFSGSTGDLVLNRPIVGIGSERGHIVAVNDSYSVTQDQKLTVPAPGILANDQAPGGRTVRAVLNTGPSHAAPGGFTLNADGSFTYTPSPGFNGTDSFTYHDSAKGDESERGRSNIATVTIEVLTPASVRVTKAETSPGAGGTVTSGQTAPIVYQLAIANPGQTPSGPVTVTDPIPSGTTYVGSAGCPAGLTSSTTPGCTVTASSSGVVWTLSSVPATTTYTVAFSVTVDAGDLNGSTISNQASFTAVNTPGCSGSPCGTNQVVNPVVTPASVSVTKSELSPGAGNTVVAGTDAITYQLTVVNAGGSPSGALTVNDPIPAGTTFVGGSASCPSGLGSSSTPTCAASVSSGTAHWSLSSVPALTTYHLGFTASVDSGDADGSTLANQATFTNVNTASCPGATCSTNQVSNPVRNSPFARDDTYLAQENQVLIVGAPGVASNDSNPGGGTLTTAVVSNPTHGALSLAADGSFHYTPNNGFFGADSFTYRDTNGTSNSNTATVHITVNAPPVAVDDAYVTNPGVTLTVSAPGVLGNDSDPDGDPITASLVTATAHGLVTLHADGSFVYVPAPAFSGPDGFTYRANDGSAASNLATVSITVDVPPTVIATLPANGATAVLAASTVQINFDKSVSATNSSFKLECPVGTPVAFSVSASPATAFTLTPGSSLPAGAICRVTLVAGQVSDLLGTTMSADYVFAFTVDSPPVVTSTLPATGATNVPVTSTVTVNFDRPVNVTSPAFRLECPVGTPVGFNVSPIGPAATFVLTPTAPLPAGTVCTVTAVATQIADVPGTRLPADSTATFTVDAAPTVTATNPFDGVLNVTATTTYQVTFNKAVNVSASAFTLECPTGTPIAFALAPTPPGGATTYTLTPNSPLPSGALCTVTVVAGQVTDLLGTNMAVNKAFGFTVDTPPLVVSTVPASNGVAVPTSTVTVTFNKSVNVTASAFTLECPTGTPVPFTLAPTPPGGATTFTLSPNSPLTGGVTCTVTIVGSQVADLAGTPMVTTGFSFVVDTPPVMTTTTPADTAVNVALNATITINFDKAVGVTSGAFKLECPVGTPVAFSVAPAGPATAYTLTPSANLPSNTACTITAVAAHIADALGTNMAADATFGFTTLPVPTAQPQSFSGAVGNTTFGVGTSPSQPSTTTSGNVLTGDTNGGAGTLSVVAGPITAVHGSVSMNADGTFTYNPTAGFAGPTDTFTYTVSNTFATASNTVTINLSNRVWYINNAGVNGTGTSISPFNNLASAGTASFPGDFLFAYGSAPSYTGGITLKAGQTLVGQSVGLVVAGHTLVTAAGTAPTITNAGGTGITLGEADTLEGLTVNATSGAAIAASGVNAITIDSSVTISSPTGNGIDINGGNGTASIGAPISVSSGTSHAVAIQNRTGGTATLSGLVTDNGAGILLNANTGATVNFTGGVVASTGTHAGFTATGGGIVSVTGSNNTLTSTSGTALHVDNTTIGASGLTFKSISSNGAVDGILLVNTGSSGGLTVAGTGSAGSGGTIQNSSGHGISATNTANLNLSWMSILNNGGTTGDGVFLTNVFGSGQLTSSTISGSGVENLLLTNSSGTLSAFNIQGPSCAISNNSTGTSGNTGISVLATLTSNMTVTINNCAFSGNRTDALHTDAADSSTLHSTITNNVFTAGTGGANQGNIGIDVSGAVASTLTYTINNNKVGTPDGTTNAHLINTGINVFTAGTSSSAVGTVTNNIVFGPGTGASGWGIRVATGSASTGRSRVQGNAVHNLGFDDGILVDVGLNTGSTASGDMGILSNTVDSPDPTTGLDSIRVITHNAATSCVTINNNIASTTPFFGVVLRSSNTALFKLDGSSPPGTETALQAQTYAQAQNPVSSVSASAAATASYAGVAAGTCNIP